MAKKEEAFNKKDPKVRLAASGKTIAALREQYAGRLNSGKGRKGYRENRDPVLADIRESLVVAREQTRSCQ